MARISTIAVEAPNSTTKLIGNVGSTTKGFNVNTLPGLLPSTAGTSGQVLQTTGGIPTWKDQSDLTGTPDPSTGHITTAGTSGQYLQTTGGAAAWVDLVDPSTGHITTAGTSGQILQTTGGAATWVDANTLPDPSTGHISTLGTSGQVLQSTGGAAVWVDQSDLTGTPDPSTGHITTAGTSGQILQTTGGAAVWKDQSDLVDPSTGHITTAGSSEALLQTTGGAATWVATSAVLAKMDGPIGTTIGGKAVFTGAAAVEWIDDDWGLTAIIDGGGSDLTTGFKGMVRVPWDAGIESYEFCATTGNVSSGSVGIDLYVEDFSSSPATSASKITDSSDINISSGNQRTSGPNTSWTTLIVAGDYISFDVTDPSSGVTLLAFSIWGRKLSTV